MEVAEPLWKFFIEMYGGGPIILIKHYKNSASFKNSSAMLPAEKFESLSVLES